MRWIQKVSIEHKSLFSCFKNKQKKEMAKKRNWKDAEYCHHATLPISLDIIGLPFRNFVMRDLDIIFSFYFLPLMVQ